MTLRLELVFLRHGHAEDPAPGHEDHDRKLTNRGRQEARATATGLLSRSLLPDATLCSDAQRTRDTAAEVTQVLGPQSPKVVFHPDLYHATQQMVRDLLEKTLGKERRVLVIGHNPTLSLLVTLLSGEAVQLATAEAAHLTYESAIEGAPNSELWSTALSSNRAWSLVQVWRG